MLANSGYSKVQDDAATKNLFSSASSSFFQAFQLANLNLEAGAGAAKCYVLRVPWRCWVLYDREVTNAPAPATCGLGKPL